MKHWCGCKCCIVTDHTETYHDPRQKQIWCSDGFSPRSRAGWCHDDTSTKFVVSGSSRNKILETFTNQYEFCARIVVLNTKRYIQEDLIPTLPSYKHPDFVHSSNIGIVFDFNVYTRAHFSLRAQITSNSNFYRYVTRTIYSCLFPLMKRQQPRNVW